MFLISNIFSFLFIIISEFLKDSINLSKHERLFLYILNIVTTSFIASSIFYYVQSYRPRKLIKKKSYLSIEPYLIKLNADLNIFNYWFDGKLYFDENGVPSGKRGITTLRIFLTIYDPFIFNA